MPKRSSSSSIFVCLCWGFTAQSTQWVMSSAVSLPNHMLTGQALSSKRLTGIVHILSPETDNCPSWISGRERMIVEIFHDQSPRKNVADFGGGWTRDLLVSSRMRIQLSHRGRLINLKQCLKELIQNDFQLLHLFTISQYLVMIIIPYISKVLSTLRQAAHFPPPPPSQKKKKKWKTGSPLDTLPNPICWFIMFICCAISYWQPC